MNSSPVQLDKNNPNLDILKDKLKVDGDVPNNVLSK